jgi:hypothetical protein
MKKITTSRKANRRPPRERKNPNGTQNQLSKRRSSATSTKSKEHPNMNTTLEQPINEQTKVSVVEVAKEHVEFTRGQLGKAKRAFAKAGQPDVSEEVRKKWLAKMSAAHVNVMGSSSSRSAKVIKGEIAVSEFFEVAG